MKAFKTTAVLVIALMTTKIASADINAQIASLQIQVEQLQNQISHFTINNTISTDPSLSWQMMSLRSGVGKERYLLRARQFDMDSSLIFGGYIQGDVINQHSSENGFNAIPMSNGASFGNATGNSATKFFMSNTAFSLTGAINTWLTSYMQTGAKNIGTADSGDNIAIQDAYLLLGNLNRSPFYAYAGHKDIDFGNFASVNMYNSSLTRDFFEALGNTAGIGINSDGFAGVISMINGGDNGINLNTTNHNTVDNYAINLSYGINSNAMHFDFGGGYLNGSHFLNTSNQTDGAWDLNAQFSDKDFDLLGEYVATTSKSYGATVDSPALNATVAQTVNIWDLGADYHFQVSGISSVLSIDYSNANLASGSANHLQQYVLGYRIEPIANLWIGCEYSYNENGINASDGTLFGSTYTSNTIILDVTAVF